MDRDAVAATVQPEHSGAPEARVAEVEQRADRGGLAGAVGAEESEHLSGLDAQVQVVDGDGLAERLRQPIGFDRGGHGWIGVCCCSSDRSR